MEAIEDPVVRTPDHAKLLDYGLDQKVADRLDQIFQVISSGVYIMLLLSQISSLFIFFFPPPPS